MEIVPELDEQLTKSLTLEQGHTGRFEAFEKGVVCNFYKLHC